MGMQNYTNAGINKFAGNTDQFTDTKHGYPSPEMDEMDGTIEKGGLVKTWLEMYDYVGGNKFRGFVAEQDGENTMFVFFDQSVHADDLKPGLMALLELCELSHFNCSRLMLCLDRRTETRAMDALVKDLGWIGFQLATLGDWTHEDDLSDRWFFMGMDV